MCAAYSGEAAIRQGKREKASPAGRLHAFRAHGVRSADVTTSGRRTGSPIFNRTFSALAATTQYGMR